MRPSIVLAVVAVLLVACGGSRPPDRNVTDDAGLRWRLIKCRQHEHCLERAATICKDGYTDRYELKNPREMMIRCGAPESHDIGSEKLDAELAAIRRSPKVPEVGAAIAEARALCQQQRGEFVNRSSTIGCKIRSQTLFACTLDTDSRTDRCDGFYEGADFAASRQAVEGKHGPASRESISADGFRVFEYAAGAETVIVTMYARGVRMTHAKRLAEATSTP